MTSQPDDEPGPGGHLPSRPTWACAECGGDWPCPVKRRGLLAEFGGAGVSLGVYLGACLVRAMSDLSHLPVGELRQRFLGWLPRPGVRRAR